MITFDKQEYYKSLEKIIFKEVENYYNKSILITGANGLIGGTILDFLLFLNENYYANITIFALVRNELNLQSFFSRNNINVIRQSVTDKIEIEDKVDFVFHTASNAHPNAYDLYPVDTIITSVEGTKRVLDFCVRFNAKLLFVSSSEVYGELRGSSKFHIENEYGYIDILNPRACYPESKRLAETLIISYIKEFNINAVIVRPAYIFGPRFNFNSNRADVEFLKKGLLGNEIVLKSPGEQKRSYCYVLDCITAILISGLFGKNGEAYNISSHDGDVRLVDFANKIANISNVPLKFELGESKGGSPVVNSLLSNSKIKSIGWSEKFTMEEAIKDTFNILR